LRHCKSAVQRSTGDTDIVGAMVPLMNMFGYVNNLRSMSQGRASFMMTYDHYAPVSWPDDDPPPAAAAVRA
jgi:translation elongation factor EF-G